MRQPLQAILVLAIGALLMVLAYRMSAATGRELRETNERLSQQYRCIIARGRPLRGASPEACRAVGY